MKTETNSLSIKRQQGLSALSLIVYICLFVFVTTCVIKISPVYIENRTFRSILKDLSVQFEKERANKVLIEQKIRKRLQMDMIEGISPKDIIVSKEDRKYVVTADYENRIPLFGNIDVVIKFNDIREEIPAQ